MNALSSRKEKVITSRLLTEHTRLTHEYLMAAEEKPRHTTCGTELSVSYKMLTARRRTEQSQNFQRPRRSTRTEHKHH